MAVKILLLTQIYPEPDDRDGYKPTKTVEYFAKEWVLAGHEVMAIHCQTKFPALYYLIPNKLANAVFKNTYALIPTYSSRKRLIREEHGVKVCRLPMIKFMPSTPFPKWEMNRQVKRIISLCNKLSYRPDIVMGHFANPCFELTARVGSELGTRTSFVFHNDCKKGNVERYHLKQYADSIDIIGGRSIIEADSIKKNLDLQYDPFICYSGVPNETVESIDRVCVKHSVKAENIEFLYVGGLVVKKHVDTVIRAFHSVYQEGFHLTIVGGGPEEEHLHQLVDDMGLCDAISFTGRLSRDQVAAKMKEANIFAMVSEAETFGMVYLEAMLQGCIVIASIGGGFDGIIENGKNGYLSNAGDADKLSIVFRNILAMPKENWDKIGQAAIDTARNFSEKTVAEHYINAVTQKK